MKVIRELKIYKAISYLATYMLRWGYVPLPLKHGRTILIFKNGDPAEVKNWRPITIFSLICRIVERINDTKFRMFLCLNANRRGCMATPGAYINSSILNGCLTDSKLKHKDCTVVFLI